ncbi:bifunctional DNA primase/polymerase [Nitrosococcus wardiae]|uniref:Bifunctional DNA primase/polymerase n=1 Tax=Nitrosococcus wardiae TaxID=1814290 RepID=A0A4P7BUW0_9GAMM|nr:bifunctional DNA primase/polymerase [Nitrosococcus wardiae]
MKYQNLSPETGREGCVSRNGKAPLGGGASDGAKLEKINPYYTLAPHDLKAHALLYAEWGWRVFPVHTPIKGGGCSCRNPKCENVGKHPRTRNGLKDATTDPRLLRAGGANGPVPISGLPQGKGRGLSL